MAPPANVPVSPASVVTSVVTSTVTVVATVTKTAHRLVERQAAIGLRNSLDNIIQRQAKAFQPVVAELGVLIAVVAIAGIAILISLSNISSRLERASLDMTHTPNATAVTVNGQSTDTPKAMPNARPQAPPEPRKPGPNDTVIVVNGRTMIVPNRARGVVTQADTPNESGTTSAHEHSSTSQLGNNSGAPISPEQQPYDNSSNYGKPIIPVQQPYDHNGNYGQAQQPYDNYGNYGTPIAPVQHQYDINGQPITQTQRQQHLIL